MSDLPIPEKDISAAMIYPALAVGNYFIQKNLESPKRDHHLSIMKLQKLIYMAHGLWLASRDVPLINETIEAWRFGPVIRSVYDHYKSYGLNILSSLAVDELTRQPYEVKELEVCEFLEEIRKSTLEVTAFQMSNWSHEKGSPWDTIYNETEYGDTGYASIPTELIKAYFKMYSLQ